MPISLGVARGKISIDTTDVSKARVSVERESRGINNALKKAGEGADFNAWYKETSAALKKTGTEAEKTGVVVQEAFRKSKKSADDFGSTLNKVGRDFALVSIGAGLIAGQGIKAATSVEQVNIKFLSLGRSQARAEALMKKVADRAKEMNLPVLSTQQAFAGLIPFIGQSTEAINKYVGITARLMVVNPLATTEDALFSLREAISSGGTDLISLAERFNLPKKRLRELVDQTGDFAKALDIVLNEMGATEQSAKQIGGIFGGTMNRMLDAFNRVLAAGFGPLVKAVTPLLEQAADALERMAEQNPGILQIGAGFTIVLGAVTPVLLAVGQLVNLFKTLSELQFVKNLASGLGGLKTVAGGLAKDLVAGKGAGRALGIGLAAAGGLELGVGASRLLGQIGVGDPRLKDATQDEAKALLVERLKQFAVIAVSVVTDFIKGFVKVLALIGIAVESLGKVLEYGATYLKEGFGKIVEVLGSAVTAIAEFTSRIPGLEQQSLTLLTAGANLQARGNTIQSEALTRRTQLGQELSGQGLATRVAEVFAGIDEAIDPVRDKLTKGLAEFLFPPDAEDKLTDSAKRFQEASAEVGTEVANGISDLIDVAKQAVTGFLDRAIKSVSFNQDQIDAFAEFQEDQTTIQQKGQDDREKENKGHQERLEKIEEDANNAIEGIHERAKKRAAEDEQDLIDLRAEIADRAKERAAENEQALQDKRLEIAANTKEQVEAEESSYRNNREQIIKEANEAGLKLEQQYNDDLKALRQDRRRAASNLDARAVAATFDREGELGDKLKRDRDALAKQTEERLAAADREHTERLAQIQSAGEKELAQFATQQQKKEQTQAAADAKEIDKLIAKQTARAQLQATEDAAEIKRINDKRAQERTAEDAAHVLKLNQITAQTNRELQLREQAFIKQFNQLAGSENAKLKIAGQGQAAMEAQLRAWYNRQTAILAGLPSVHGGGGPTAAGPTPGFGFATGTPLVQRDMVAQIHRGEGVMSAPVAAMARSLLGQNYAQPQMAALLAGRGQASPTTVKVDARFDLGNIGEHNLEEVGALMEQKLGQFAINLSNKLRGQAS
ncbi:MAG: hypothetical protein KF716_08805 [Anaerolineae bacterium]|nr:hypothetical protein [Anaerolineae bacterium]